MNEAAHTFTASQIGFALGVSARRAHQLLQAAPGVEILHRGQSCRAWSIESLPEELQTTLANKARSGGYRNTAHLLSDPAGKWMPEIPLAEIDDIYTAEASRRRAVIAPVIQRESQKPVSELVHMVRSAIAATPDFPFCSDRTLRRWIETAIERDRGRGDWNYIALYLDERMKRKELPRAGSVASLNELLNDVANPLALAKWEQVQIWGCACEICNGADCSPEIKREVLTAIKQSGVRLAESPSALRRQLDRKLKVYSGNPEDLNDRRHENPGASPIVLLNDAELKQAKQYYLQTGSKTTALRMLAQLPWVREEVAECINKQRGSKHTITKSIRNQLDIPQAVKDYHKSPKYVRINSLTTPRTNEYILPSGERKILQPGDLFERDDMSNNFLCYVDWPWGGDPCSEKYGVRVARGQNLMMIDVASLYFTSFNYLIRAKDSYRADDIWNWIGHTYRDIGMPRIGERWERGTWQAKRLRGEGGLIDRGHTEESLRRGGMSDLGLRVIVSQSPTTKIIENRFRFFQTVCGTITGQIGRQRGEMERETKIWMECQQGRRDPRNYFLNYAEACNQIEDRIRWANNEPVEGLKYKGVPAAIWKDGIEAAPLKKLSPEQGYLFARDKKSLTVRQAKIQVRYTSPDYGRSAWEFYHEDLHRYDGLKMDVYFDRACVSEGAVMVVAQGRDAGKIIGNAELINGCPQFRIGGSSLITEPEGIQRKRDFMDAVISEYRSIGLDGRQRSRVRRVEDGAGQSMEVKTGGNRIDRNFLREPVAAEGVELMTRARNANRKSEQSREEYNAQMLFRLKKQERELVKMTPSETFALYQGDTDRDSDLASIRRQIEELELEMKQPGGNRSVVVKDADAEYVKLQRDVAALENENRTKGRIPLFSL